MVPPEQDGAREVTPNGGSCRNWGSVQAQHLRFPQDGVIRFLQNHCTEIAVNCLRCTAPGFISFFPFSAFSLN